MARFLKFRSLLYSIELEKLQNRSLYLTLNRFFHYGSKSGFVSADPSSSYRQETTQNVAIFWDLDNKPPKSISPYNAAVRLKMAASSFGIVRSMVAYANHHSFSYVPPEIREIRRDRKYLNQLENKGISKPAEPYLCRICGRKFWTNEKLLNHFKQLHEREQTKRLNRIESSRGKMRVKLVSKFSMKMQKYKNASREVLTPKVGYGLADELKQAGFWVQAVSDKPQAADIALRNHMVDMMDKKRMECLILVSDDSDFVDVLKEAKLRCVKTVVVGDVNDGVLKRVSDAGFLWREILTGKVKKEAGTVVGRWKDRDVLKKLEWRYVPESEKLENDDGVEETIFEEDHDHGHDYDNGVEGTISTSCAWWELNDNPK